MYVLSIRLLLRFILQVKRALISDDALILCECLLVLQFDAHIRYYLLTLWNEIVLKVHFFELCDCEPQVHIIGIYCAVKLSQINTALSVATISHDAESIV